MKIKVILKETIKGVGKKDDIIEVKDGYANNFLFPQNKAVIANEANINKLKNSQNLVLKNKERELKEANSLKELIEKSQILLKIKTGKDNKVFGSIGPKEIEKAIIDQLKLKLDKKKLGIDVKLNTLGLHNVELKLHKDVKAILKVKVEGI